LEFVDRRVFAELIVADRGSGHCGPHAGSRACNRIGAEIDHGSMVSAGVAVK
jgi:hypothetical protein